MKENLQRICSNCCASDNGSCLNLMQMEYNPNNVCDDHETKAEFDADVAALRVFRQRIGLPPDTNWQGI
jgi:hypothetical protein